MIQNSDLEDTENLPNVIEQEDKLDSKKNERERLGAVNLRADEETKQFYNGIEKLEGLLSNVPRNLSAEAKPAPKLTSPPGNSVTLTKRFRTVERLSVLTGDNLTLRNRPV